MKEMAICTRSIRILVKGGGGLVVYFRQSAVTVTAAAAEIDRCRIGIVGLGYQRVTLSTIGLAVFGRISASGCGRTKMYQPD